jgi:hypothetical protein
VKLHFVIFSYKDVHVRVLKREFALYNISAVPTVPAKSPRSRNAHTQLPSCYSRSSKELLTTHPTIYLVLRILLVSQEYNL